MHDTPPSLSIKDPNVHDLFDFVISVTNEMEAEYARIQKRVKEDPGTAGDQGEENWKQLFEDWLPPTYKIVTKGRIIGHAGSASSQVDVLVLHPEYPRRLLDKKLYLAGGVAAAFECKLTLRTEHIRSAIKNAAKIRRLTEPRKGSPHRELFSPIIYGVLAHSHEWKAKKSHPLQNITRGLYRWTNCGVQHPRELIDVLCVSDLGIFPVAKRIKLDPPLVGRATGVQTGYMEMVPQHIWRKYDPLLGAAELQDLHRPIGSLLCFLLKTLARENEGLRNLAEYFVQTRIHGMGAGLLKDWPLTVFSSELQSVLESLIERPPITKWNEWSSHFH